MTCHGCARFVLLATTMYDRRFHWACARAYLQGRVDKEASL